MLDWQQPYAKLVLDTSTNTIDYTHPFSKPITFNLPEHFKARPLYAAAMVATPNHCLPLEA